ncbi:family with sequence similarity 13 member C [Rhinolophus ferrumequinum]|uniref:Family with sequence similarity 13 member C n=1 Tax=Rhinolophus ferrumequinum TaxID=59479 RepID=A0A7J7UWK2_RHIFE|nr:family with sequence similarity 13 member C [Rhinolophus ferrumequinum]
MRKKLLRCMESRTQPQHRPRVCLLKKQMLQTLRQSTVMCRMEQTVRQKTSNLLGPAGCSITSLMVTTHCCHRDAPSSAKARDST